MYILIRNLEIDNLNIIFHVGSRHKVKHMIPFKSTDNFELCKVENLKNKLFKVGSFLCKRPNAIEENL